MSTNEYLNKHIFIKNFIGADPNTLTIRLLEVTGPQTIEPDNIYEGKWDDYGEIVIYKFKGDDIIKELGPYDTVEDLKTAFEEHSRYLIDKYVPKPEPEPGRREEVYGEHWFGEGNVVIDGRGHELEDHLEMDEPDEPGSAAIKPKKRKKKKKHKSKKRKSKKRKSKKRKSKKR